MLLEVTACGFRLELFWDNQILLLPMLAIVSRETQHFSIFQKWLHTKLQQELTDLTSFQKIGLDPRSPEQTFDPAFTYEQIGQ